MSDDQPCNLNPDFKYLRGCKDETGRVFYCSQAQPRCFIHLVNGKVVKAGCVEPDTSWDILNHQNTHFCTNTEEPYDGCFDPLKVDYSKRISCYSCHEDEFNAPTRCAGPENLRPDAAAICPVGASRCVVAAYKTDVKRGCDTWTDTTAQFCRLNPGRCLFCDTNYCNGLAPVKNYAQCYTTLTHPSDENGYAFKMDVCRGVLPVATDQPCYVGDLNAVTKRAGCIEDIDHQMREENLRRGDIRVIFEGKLHCYKCRSKTRNSCFSVRWEKPQLCEDDDLTADRGCYTLFDLTHERIQRGCVSDLSVYMRGACMLKYFEQFCILCTTSHCNIHDNPEDYVDAEWWGGRSRGARTSLEGLWSGVVAHIVFYIFED